MIETEHSKVATLRVMIEQHPVCEKLIDDGESFHVLLKAGFSTDMVSASYKKGDTRAGALQYLLEELNKRQLQSVDYPPQQYRNLRIDYRAYADNKYMFYGMVK